MLPAFSSRHLGVSTFPSLPPRVSLTPGRSTKSPAPPVSARARARLPRAQGPRPALTSPRSGQEGRRRTAPPPPTPRSPSGRPGSARPPPERCQGAAQKFTARPGPQRRPRSRAPASPTPPRASAAAPPAPPAGQGNAPPRRAARPAQPGPPAPSARPAARQVQLSWPAASGGRRPGRGAPDGAASGPRAPTCAAHSTGVAGRPGREVAAAPAAGREGVRPGAFPRSHLPPSRESPRAGPRARQCARAALPSTAGGGGAAGGGRAVALGGARRRPRGPPPPPCPAARRPCGGTSGASPGPGAEPPRGGLPQAPEPRSFLQGPKALATPDRRERAKLGEEAPRLRHLSEACPRPWAGPKPSV